MVDSTETVDYPTVTGNDTTSAEDYGGDYNKFTDEEYKEFIADYLWPTPLEFGFVGVFFLLMVVGVVGNCLVVYVVTRNKHMWSSMNLYLTNLAVSDLLVLIFCLPPTVFNDITKTFWFSAYFCKAIVFCQNTSVYVSILTLVCVSFERWRAVCSPLAIARWRTIHVIVCIWTLAFILSVPEPVTLTIMPHSYARSHLSITWGTRCAESWSTDFQQKYQLVQTIALFLLPLLLISGLCIHMTIVLQRKALQIGERQLRNRKKAIKMLAMVVLIFAGSYMPVHVHNIAASFNYSPPATEANLTLIALRKFIPRFMSYSSSCLNPILYNFMSEKFRKEFRRACFCGTVVAKRRRRQLWLAHAQDSNQNPVAVAGGGGGLGVGLGVGNGTSVRLAFQHSLRGNSVCAGSSAGGGDCSRYF